MISPPPTHPYFPPPTSTDRTWDAIERRFNSRWGRNPESWLARSNEDDERSARTNECKMSSDSWFQVTATKILHVNAIQICITPFASDFLRMSPIIMLMVDCLLTCYARSQLGCGTDLPGLMMIYYGTRRIFLYFWTRIKNTKAPSQP